MISGKEKLLNENYERGDAMRSLGAERSAQGENYEPTLTVRTYKKDQAVTIEIQDNGPGIPNEIKEKVLQPFFTSKKGTAGTGLGLSITNDIVKAHGGEVRSGKYPWQKSRIYHPLTKTGVTWYPQRTTRP